MDAKNSRKLEQDSIKTLLWLLYNKEPNDKKVSYEILIIPWENEILTLENWVRYLACTKTKGVFIDQYAKIEFDSVFFVS